MINNFGSLQSSPVSLDSLALCKLGGICLYVLKFHMGEAAEAAWLDIVHSSLETERSYGCQSLPQRVSAEAQSLDFHLISVVCVPSGSGLFSDFCLLH